MYTVKSYDWFELYVCLGHQPLRQRIQQGQPLCFFLHIPDGHHEELLEHQRHTSGSGIRSHGECICCTSFLCLSPYLCQSHVLSSVFVVHSVKLAITNINLCVNDILYTYEYNTLRGISIFCSVNLYKLHYVQCTHSMLCRFICITYVLSSLYIIYPSCFPVNLCSHIFIS